MTDIETDFTPRFKQDVSNFTTLDDFANYLGYIPTPAQNRVFERFLSFKEKLKNIRLSHYQEIHPKYLIKIEKDKIKFIRGNKGRFIRIPKYLKESMKKKK